jgi:hypothetical protein
VKIFHIPPVLRGFSRSVKQDSEASNASGGVSEASVAGDDSIISSYARKSESRKVVARVNISYKKNIYAK